MQRSPFGSSKILHHPTSYTIGMVFAVAMANALMPIELLPNVSLGTPIIAITFLINELSHRRFGPAIARQVVWRGFAAALVLSLWLAQPRVAIASATAFLLSQLLDIAVFRSLRSTHWWIGPLCASLVGSTIDTVVFFLLAFYGTDDVWWRFAVADGAFKVALDVGMLLPFRVAMAQRGPEGVAIS